MNEYVIAIRCGRTLVTVNIVERNPDMAMVAAMNLVWDEHGVEPEDQFVLTCTQKVLTH